MMDDLMKQLMEYHSKQLAKQLDDAILLGTVVHINCRCVLVEPRLDWDAVFGRSLTVDFTSVQ